MLVIGIFFFSTQWFLICHRQYPFIWSTLICHVKMLSIWVSYASDKHFLLVQKCLWHFQRQIPLFEAHFNSFQNKPLFLHVCNALRGKRRICSWRAISPFPTVFSTLLENFSPFSSILKLSSANFFRSEKVNYHLQTLSIWTRNLWVTTHLVYPTKCDENLAFEWKWTKL